MVIDRSACNCAINTEQRVAEVQETQTGRQTHKGGDLFEVMQRLFIYLGRMHFHLYRSMSVTRQNKATGVGLSTNDCNPRFKRNKKLNKDKQHALE